MKKKILFITHSADATGGAEDDFVRLCSYFSHVEDYEIEILTPPGPRVKSYMKYALRTGTYIWGFFPVIYEGLLPYVKYFMKSIIQILQVRKFIKGNKYDLCILNVSVLLWPLVFLKFKHIKSLVFIRETVEPAFLRKWFYNIISKRGEYFIAVSKSIEKDFIYITSNNRIETLYSSVETNTAEMNEKSDSNMHQIPDSVLQKIQSDERTKCISIGELGMRKNQILVLESLIYMRKMNFKLPLVVFVGKCNERSVYSNDVLRFVSANNLESQCVFLGELPRESFLRVLGLMDAVVISSLSEGMPLTIADSFMLGKPVISTRVGGIPEVVIDNYNGILVDTDAKSFSEGLINFMKRDTSDNSLNINALKSFSENFDLNKNMKRLELIFKELV